MHFQLRVSKSSCEMSKLSANLTEYTPGRCRTTTRSRMFSASLLALAQVRTAHSCASLEALRASHRA